MTLFATDSRVRSGEGKTSLRMIKAGQVGPGIERMACFASKRGAVSTKSRHLKVELTAMGIRVAAGACAVVESIRNYLVVAEFRRVMAIGTYHCHMCAFQRKPGLLVLCNRVGRRRKTFDRVAVLASVSMGGGGELPRMSVGVTIGTFGERNVVSS